MSGRLQEIKDYFDGGCWSDSGPKVMIDYLISEVERLRFNQDTFKKQVKPIVDRETAKRCAEIADNMQLYCAWDIANEIRKEFNLEE